MAKWPSILAIGGGLLLSSTQLSAGSVCRPVLTVKAATFTMPVNLRRYWHAIVSADASSCTTQSGLFTMGFVRLAENGPDLSFVEPFIWHVGENKIRVEFWADEAVGEHWIADVAPCRCLED
jgi:hypothetical protein